MLDFDRAGESLLRALQYAVEECTSIGNQYICTEHLLLALVRDEESTAAQALATMKIDEETTRNEVEKQLKEKTESELLYTDRPDLIDSHLQKGGQSEVSGLSDLSMQALRRAESYSLFFGVDTVEPEHLVLALLDLPDAGAMRVLEDLGANLTFLRRQIMQFMAHDLSLYQELPSLKDTTINGLRELIDRNYFGVTQLQELSGKSRHPLQHLPARSEIVHMVCVGYFSDFLFNQVAFRRYLLEETLELLGQRTGPLDKEQTASIVSSSAQNLRAEVRGSIEYMLTNEYRMFNHMMDEAEYDLIGSVIEDLWWAQGEEIAVHELFDEALDDHRRKHLLNLQKRRLEISQRLSKLKEKLDDTIRQCFWRRSASA